MGFPRRITSRAVIVGIFLNVFQDAVASNPATSNGLFCIQRSSSSTRSADDIELLIESELNAPVLPYLTATSFSLSTGFGIYLRDAHAHSLLHRPSNTE